MERPTVVFPHPLSPTSPSVSPGLIVKETSSTAFSGVIFPNPVRIGKYCLRCSTSSRFSLMSSPPPFLSSVHPGCWPSRRLYDSRWSRFRPVSAPGRFSWLNRTAGRMHSPSAYSAYWSVFRKWGSAAASCSHRSGCFSAIPWCIHVSDCRRFRLPFRVRRCVRRTWRWSHRTFPRWRRGHG